MPPWAAHPAFAPYAKWLREVDTGMPPDAATLSAWARSNDTTVHGRPLTFASATSRLDALAYESAVVMRGVVAVREDDWHDAFNALAWLALPRTKAALNAMHVRGGRAGTPNARNRARDAATLLDECGLLLACDEARVADLLRERAWHALFVRGAAVVATRCRPIVIGHGLLDRLRRPYRALTARVLVVACEPGTLPAVADANAVDALAEPLIAGGRLTPSSLPPLPVAALPAWDTEQLGAALFDDVSVFRPKVLRSSP